MYCIEKGKRYVTSCMFFLASNNLAQPKIKIRTTAFISSSQIPISHRPLLSPKQQQLPKERHSTLPYCYDGTSPQQYFSHRVASLTIQSARILAATLLLSKTCKFLCFQMFQQVQEIMIIHFLRASLFVGTDASHKSCTVPLRVSIEIAVAGSTLFQTCIAYPQRKNRWKDDST